MKKFIVLPILLLVFAAPMMLKASNRQEKIKSASITGAGKLVDVSENNDDNIQWNRVKNGGVRGVYLKVSEGVNYRDGTTTTRRIQAIKSSGLHYGLYHFLRPKKRAPEAEAHFFVREAARLGGWGDFVPAVDVEDFRMSPVQTAEYLAGFLGALREEGVRTILVYSNPTFWNDSRELAMTSDLKQELRFAKAWIADYGDGRPEKLLGIRGYSLHQRGIGRSKGIDGKSDQNHSKNLSLLLR